MSGQVELSDVLQVQQQMLAEMKQQTEVIRKLVCLQETLMAALAEEGDQEQECETYMDGSPVL